MHIVDLSYDQNRLYLLFFDPLSRAVSEYAYKKVLYTVVKWLSIIWLFGKKNNASKKIWEFVVPEIFRILVNEPSKLAQKNAILC